MVFYRLEDMYFSWLITKVMNVDHNRTPTTSYDTLLKTLHNTEFAWTLPGDDNRSADGKELRTEFLIASDAADDPDWRTLFPASVLEMLIAFSRRCEFNSDILAREWFWIMIDNLNLKEANDASRISPYEIEEVLEPFMWRQYAPDGDGGLFPLENPTRDQRDLEIWQQFCDYLVDKKLLPA